MDLKAAITTAKQHLMDVFVDESVTSPQLEEVWFDEVQSQWCVTLGFWRKPTNPMIGVLANRDYKVVRIDALSGKPISIRNRDLSAA